MPEARTVYLIGGSDEFAIKEHAAALAAKLAPKTAGEFGVETIEGDAANADEALKILGKVHEALQTVGFFGADKLVWLKNTNLFAPVTPGGEATVEALNSLNDALKRGLPGGVILLISALGFDKRRAVAKTIEKMAEKFFFDAPEAGKEEGEEKIEGFIRERLNAEKKRFANADAMDAFRGLVAPTLREIANELEKLCIYVGKRAEVTEADVRAICSASRQAVIWELVEAISQRNLPKAIGALENLLDNEDSAIGIVMMLVTQFRLMILARDLVDRKVLRSSNRYSDYAFAFKSLPVAEKDHFPRTKEGAFPNEWRFGRAAAAANNFSRAELVRAMDLLLEANLQLVSTQLDERLVLEETLTRIARK
ncbi:MAG: DNA polymerase III subunit delta [Verrucomicrobia bacterium]|nr:DNA polymerase III subunit delta [Verrucomicrobiota bacterium]